MSLKKKEPKKKDVINYREIARSCIELIGRYLLTIGNIQDRMFEEYDGGERNLLENFYQLNKLEDHIQLSSCFSKCYEKNDLPSLTEILQEWEKIFDIAFKYDLKIQKNLSSVAKYVACLCLLEGKYYEAVLCLWNAVKLNNDDLNTWSILIRWVIFLEEWNILQFIFSEEEKATTSANDNYKIYRECCYLLFQFNTTTPIKQNEFVLNILEKLDYITKNNKQTFTYSQCRTILLNGLCAAAKLPRADLNKIGDPIANRAAEVDTCNLILRSRFSPFFDVKVSSSIYKRTSNIDDFLKICSSIADYLETCNLYIEELFESGLTREAECGAIGLWKYCLAFGVPYRAFRPLAFLFYLKSTTTFERHMLKYYEECLNTLLTPKTATNSNFITTPKSTKIRESSYRRGSIVNDSLEEMNKLEEDFAKQVTISSINIHENEPKIRTKLTKHVPNCLCGFCELKVTSWHFELLLSWIDILMDDFTLLSYNKFLLKQRELRIKIKNFRVNQLYKNIPLSKGSIEAEFLPCQFTEYFIRATICTLAQNEEHLTNDLKEKYIKEALKLASYSLLTNRSSTLFLNYLNRKIIKEKSVSNNAINQEIVIDPITASYYREQKDFCHLFFRRWRQKSCYYLGENMTGAWHKALYFLESATPSVRQYARFCGSKKDSSEISTFYIDSTSQLQEAISSLPEDLTFINLTLDDNNVLWLIRCHKLHEPIVIPVLKLTKNDTILERMRTLLIENDESATKETDSDKFWKTRYRLDHELEILIKDVQEIWFGRLAPLMLPLNHGYTKAVEEELLILYKKFYEAGFKSKSSVTLARMLDILSQDEWIGLIQSLGEIDQVRPDLIKKISLHYEWLFEKTKFERSERNFAKKYSLLVIPPLLSFIPFESMPIYKKAPFVSRIPSFHMFSHILNKIKQIPKEMDSKNSFYVLNPGGDLLNTEKRLAAFLETFSSNGIMGKIPSKDELKRALSTRDLFLYMGHGSGGRYYGRSFITECDCKAVSIIMGCSSVRIHNEGREFDGRGVIYEYLISKCPCIVGCLWLVTDGEIDRFFMSLAKFCFQQKLIENEPTNSNLTSIENTGNTSQRTGRKKKSKEENASPILKEINRCRLLIEGVVEARKACKLPYLTGASVVAFGLPVTSRLDT